MTYSSDQLITIFAAAGVLLTALGAVIVNIIVALRTGQKTDALIQKTDSVTAKVDQVHTLTNSNLSAVKAELSNATIKIESLMQVVDDLKTQRQAGQLATAFTTPSMVPTTIVDRRQLSDDPAPLPVKIIADETNPVPVEHVDKPKTSGD